MHTRPRILHTKEKAQVSSSCLMVWPILKVNQLQAYMYPLFFRFPPRLGHHRALSRTPQVGFCWVRRCSVASNSLPQIGLQPVRLLCPWDFSGKNTGVGCQFLLQAIFLIQGSNPGLLLCRWILYYLSKQESLRDALQFTQQIHLPMQETQGKRFILWVRKILWRRNWQPTPVFLLGGFHRQRSLAGTGPQSMRSQRVGHD